jgi:hypothetical protein
VTVPAAVVIDPLTLSHLAGPVRLLSSLEKATNAHIACNMGTGRLEIYFLQSTFHAKIYKGALVEVFEVFEVFALAVIHSLGTRGHTTVPQ